VPAWHASEKPSPVHLPYLVTKGDSRVKEQELLDHLLAFSKTAISKQPDETVGIGKL
jgi:hypothetical protein